MSNVIYNIGIANVYKSLAHESNEQGRKFLLPRHSRANQMLHPRVSDGQSECLISHVGSSASRCKDTQKQKPRPFSIYRILQRSGDTEVRSDSD